MDIKQNPIQKVRITDFDEFSDEDLSDFLMNLHRLKRGLQIHAAIYIIINSLTITLGILTMPYIYPIFIIASMVWFIGLGEHIVAYRMKSHEVYSKSKQGVYYHLGAFLSSIPLMALITMFIFVPIPLMIWGSIVLAHYIMYKLTDSHSILGKVESSNYDTNPKYGGFSEAQLRVLAMKKVRIRISVEIHAIIYLGSFIGYAFSGATIWSYPLYFIFAPWLILLGEHLTAYLTFSRGVYPKAKKMLYFHLATYIFSFPFWIPIMAFFWVIYTFWGVLLLIHYALFQFV
ncbi:MAG: hypothetical protein EU530_11910, partial [Promethearchaeota archaeon]